MSARATDLGRILLQRRCRPGVPLTQYDLAAWWGCTASYIYLLEQQALRKLRHRLLFIKDARLREMAEGLFDERRPAQRREAV